MGATHARPMRTDELDDVHALYDRMSWAATGRPFPIPRAYLDALYSRPHVRPETDLVTLEQDGAMVGCVVGLPSPPFSETEYYVVVDPRLADGPQDAADDVVAAAVAAALGSARGRLDEPGAGHRLVLIGVPRDERVVAPRLAQHGFARLRSMFEMQIDLPAHVPAPTLPAGVRFEVFDPDRDTDDMLAVVAGAFADHHGDEAGTPETLAHSLTLPDRVPELTLLARDDQGAVGTAWGMLRGANGYISTVGVLRRGRGRGIATALLQQCFHEFAERGVTVVTLDVDSDSLTGATRVYERAGMRVVTVMDLWATPVT